MTVRFEDVCATEDVLSMDEDRLIKLAFDVLDHEGKDAYEIHVPEPVEDSIKSPPCYPLYSFWKVTLSGLHMDVSDVSVEECPEMDATEVVCSGSFVETVSGRLVAAETRINPAAYAVEDVEVVFSVHLFIGDELSASLHMEAF